MKINSINPYNNTKSSKPNFKGAFDVRITSRGTTETKKLINFLVEQQPSGFVVCLLQNGKRFVYNILDNGKSPRGKSALLAKLKEEGLEIVGNLKISMPDKKNDLTILKTLLNDYKLKYFTANHYEGLTSKHLETTELI